METCKCDFIIEYNDIDSERKISSKGFLRLLQEAANIASSKVGYGINDMPRTNIAWLLLNWKLKIFNRPFWNEKIIIETWARHEDKLYSYRDFKIYDESNNVIAIATSKWVTANTKTHSLIRISDEMEQKYDYIEKTAFEEPFIDKIKEPKEYDSKIEYIIQRRDIDLNHHVNNLCYLNFAFQAIPEETYSMYANKFSSIEIMYKKEALLKDKIICLYKKINEDEYIVTIKSEDLKILHAIIKMKM